MAFAGKTYNDGAGGSWDCGKDPDIAINADKGKYTFTGVCKAISVNGNKNTVTIDSVGALAVNGDDITITVGSVDSISVNGDRNSVSYGKSAKPKVADNGEGNKVSGGGADKGTKTDTASAGDSGAWDCKKHPTFKLADTGGNSMKIVGACDKVEVSTGSNNLQIESVKTLVLNGGGNNVNVGAVDSIVTNGAENQVTYKKGISGAKAKISGAGADNKVVQVK
jgi:hypothetical protein